jgi:hypothetical protein
MAECVVTGDATGTLQGICPDCDRMIYRKVNPSTLEAVRGDLDVTVTKPRTRIGETERLHVKYDSTMGDGR